MEICIGRDMIGSRKPFVQSSCRTYYAGIEQKTTLNPNVTVVNLREWPRFLLSQLLPP